MTSEIQALGSAVAITPNDPDRGQREPQRRQRRSASRPPRQPESSPVEQDDPDPPVIGSRLNIRV